MSATRGETLTPNLKECDSTLTSGTSCTIYNRNTDVQSLDLIASRVRKICHIALEAEKEK